MILACGCFRDVLQEKPANRVEMLVELLSRFLVPLLRSASNTNRQNNFAYAIQELMTCLAVQIAHADGRAALAVGDSSRLKDIFRAEASENT